MPSGVAGGYPPELAWWTGGRALIPEKGVSKAGLVDGVREAGQGLGGGVQGLRFRGGRW